MAVLICMAACSSLRAPQQPEAKSEADNILRFALLQENQGSPSTLDSYRTALAKYRSFAGIEGELWALAGIARTGMASGDSLEYKASIATMDEIIADIDPNLAYIRTLTDLQILAAQDAWEAMLPLMISYPDAPQIVRTQIMSYGVQARAYLNQPDPAMASELHKLYGQVLRKAHKKGAEQALCAANAAYSLACHHYVLQRLGQAMELVETAQQLDYLYGNFRGLGYDLWLLGRIALADADSACAKAAFLKARRIFETLNNTAMLHTLEQELRSASEGDGK